MTIQLFYSVRQTMTTFSKNRFDFFRTPLQQQTEPPTSFSCRQQQAEGLVVFWDRRLLGLGDLCLRLSFLVEKKLKRVFGVFWTSPPLCELRTIVQTDIFRHRVFRVIGLCTLGPHSFFPHSVRQTFQQFLQRCSYLCFLCYAKNSLQKKKKRKLFKIIHWCP